MSSKSKQGKGNKNRQPMESETLAKNLTKQRNMAEQNLLRHRLNDLEQQRRRSIQAISDQETAILRDLQRQDASFHNSDGAAGHNVGRRDGGHSTRRSSITSGHSSNSSPRRGSSQSVDLDPAETDSVLHDFIKNGAVNRRRHTLDISVFTEKEPRRFHNGRDDDDLFASDCALLANPPRRNSSSKALLETPQIVLGNSRSSLREGPENSCDGGKNASKTVNFALEQDSPKSSHKTRRPKLATIGRSVKDGDRTDDDLLHKEQASQRKSGKAEVGQITTRDERTDSSPTSSSGPSMPHPKDTNEVSVDSLHPAYKDSLLMRPRSYSGSYVGSRPSLVRAMNRVKLEPLQTGLESEHTKRVDANVTVNHSRKPLTGFSERENTELSLRQRRLIDVSGQESHTADEKSSKNDTSSVRRTNVTSGFGRDFDELTNRRRRYSLDPNRVLAQLTGDLDINDTQAQWDDLGKYLGEFRKQHHQQQQQQQLQQQQQQQHHQQQNHNITPKTLEKPRTSKIAEEYQSVLDLPSSYSQSKLLPRRHSEGNFLVLANAVRKGHALESKYRHSRNRLSGTPSDHPCAVAENRQRNTTVKKLATVHNILQSSALSMADADYEMF